MSESGSIREKSEGTSEGRPFIIWTVQRTGGTNLALRLFERSPFPNLQHEPFNHDHVFGSITEQWWASEDAAQLECALTDALSRGVLIKHCVEMFDLKFNLALADCTISSGYRHLFLYRRNASDRLLSLHFCRVTGIWGKDEGIKDRPLVEPIPVADLVTREKRCNKLLTTIHNHILERGKPVLSLAFEDVYCEPTTEKAVERVIDLVKFLGLERGESEVRLFAKKVIGTGNHGIKHRYQDFPGVEMLKGALATVPPFEG